VRANESKRDNVTAGVKEACDLIDAGFEYVCDMDNVKIFRKRK